MVVKDRATGVGNVASSDTEGNINKKTDVIGEIRDVMGFGGAGEDADVNNDDKNKTLTQKENNDGWVMRERRDSNFSDMESPILVNGGDDDPDNADPEVIRIRKQKSVYDKTFTKKIQEELIWLQQQKAAMEELAPEKKDSISP